MPKTTVIFRLGSGTGRPVGPQTMYVRPVFEFVSGRMLVMPAPEPIDLTPGTAQRPLESGVVYEFTKAVPGGYYPGDFRYVPESETPLEFTDLLKVSPAPSADGAPSWVAGIYETRDAIDAAAAEVAADREQIDLWRTEIQQYADKISDAEDATDGLVASRIADETSATREAFNAATTSNLEALRDQPDGFAGVNDDGWIDAPMLAPEIRPSTLDARSDRALRALDGVVDTEAVGDVPAVLVDAGPAIVDWLTRAAADGHAAVRLTGRYYTRTAIDIPDAIRSIEIPAGSRVRVMADRGFRKTGSIEFVEHLPDNYTIWRTTAPEFKPADVTKYKGGDLLLMGTRIPLNGTTGNYPGWLRRCGTITQAGADSTIRVDRYWARNIQPKPAEAGYTDPLGVKIFRVTMAQSIRLWGQGQIEGPGQRAPLPAETGSLVSFHMVRDAVVDGLEISYHSRTAVAYTTCLGGGITDNTWIHHMYDNGGGGYGVSIQGACRGIRVARAIIENVRHAITTNTGPELGPDGLRKTKDADGNDLPNTPAYNYGAIGEPEGCYFGPIANNCTDKSVDSHRVGWANHFDAHVMGGGGGVQVRQDAALVTGFVYNTSGPGVFVDADVTVEAVIDIVIDGIRNPGSGDGISCLGAARIDRAVIRRVFSGYAVAAKDNVRGRNIHIEDSPLVARFVGSNSVLEVTLGYGTATLANYENAGTGNRLIIDGEDRSSEALVAYDRLPPNVIGNSTGSVAAGVFEGLQWKLPRLRILALSVRNQASPGAKFHGALFDMTPLGGNGSRLMAGDTIADLDVAGTATVAFNGGAGYRHPGGLLGVGGLILGAAATMYRFTYPRGERRNAQSLSNALDNSSLPVFFGQGLTTLPLIMPGDSPKNAGMAFALTVMRD